MQNPDKQDSDIKPFHLITVCHEQRAIPEPSYNPSTTATNNQTQNEMLMIQEISYEKYPEESKSHDNNNQTSVIGSKLSYEGKAPFTFDEYYVQKKIRSIKATFHLQTEYAFLDNLKNSSDLQGIFIPIVAVGDARTGKSTSLNIFIQELAANPDRMVKSKNFFQVESGIDRITEGLYVCLIRYCDMNEEAQKKLDNIFGSENPQEKHIVLFDCEGTGLGNPDETNKLYTTALSISLKGVFIMSTLNRILESMIETFLKNYRTHKGLLEKDKKVDINMSILIKDQIRLLRNQSNDEQENKREKNFRNVAKADEFLQIVKPMIYCLGKGDESALEELDKGNYTIDSPLVSDVKNSFWNSIRRFKAVFLENKITSSNLLRDYLRDTIHVINGGFREDPDTISKEIYECGSKFKKEVSRLLKSIRLGENPPGEDPPVEDPPGENLPGENLPVENLPGENLPGQSLISNTIQQIHQAFSNHQGELKKKLEEFKENAERIRDCMNVFDSSCNNILKSFFLDHTMIRFMHYEYLSKMFNQHSIWKVSYESVEALKKYQRGLGENDIAKLIEKCSLIFTFEKADREVRKMIENELASFPNKDPAIPLDVLKGVLMRKGPGAQFDVLKFKIKLHILYLFSLVMANYERRKNQNLVTIGFTVFGLATLGSGVIAQIALRRILLYLGTQAVTGLAGLVGFKCLVGDLSLSPKEEMQKLAELKNNFRKEIKQKGFYGLSSNDEKFLKHTEALIKKTNGIYLERLCA